MKNARKAIQADGAPVSVGPYSQAIMAGGWVYLSGQIALDPATGALTSGGVPEQTEQAMRNIGAVLKGAGLGFEHVVKTTVFMTELSRFAEMNEVYARYFKDAPPARSTVQVASLPKGASVEIEAVAFSGT